MKVGDLVRVLDLDNTCTPNREGTGYCGCWFCSSKSTRQGIIIKRLSAGVGIGSEKGYWSVVFDAGEWRVYGTEMELVSESR